MLMEALDDASADASGLDQLLNASVANADQGELGSGEKRIRCHQEKDQKHAEQHKGDHFGVILMGNSNIAKGLATGLQWRLKFFTTLRLRSGQAPSASLRAGSFDFAQDRLRIQGNTE